VEDGGDLKEQRIVLGEVVENRRMPPWHADPRHGHFANVRRLSAADRATANMQWTQEHPEILFDDDYIGTLTIVADGQQGVDYYSLKQP
jgi:hypothetical protein